MVITADGCSLISAIWELDKSKKEQPKFSFSPMNFNNMGKNGQEQVIQPIFRLAGLQSP